MSYRGWLQGRCINMEGSTTIATFTHIIWMSMGLFVVVNSSKRKTMEASQKAPSASSATKVERKVIEKNRRNQMKFLYSQLQSLLPSHSTKETLALPDQIDEAINFIRTLEAKLRKSKEKKESLTMTTKKRSYGCGHCCETSSAPSFRSPRLEIRETGSALEVVLTTALDNQFLFYEIIRILQEEGVEIVNASFSVVGNSVLHVVHSQISESASSFGATKVIDRLNRFINGSTSEIELEEPELWDFELHPQTWGF